LNQKR